MEKKKEVEACIAEVYALMPKWHTKIERPFKEMLQKMSLETYVCLTTLQDQKQMTLSELARELHMPKQNVKKLIMKLSEHDFIEHTYNERDKRSIDISLSEKAQKYLMEFQKENPYLKEILQQQFNENELQQLREALHTINHALSK